MIINFSSKPSAEMKNKCLIGPCCTGDALEFRASLHRIIQKVTDRYVLAEREARWVMVIIFPAIISVLSEIVILGHSGTPQE